MKRHMLLPLMLVLQCCSYSSPEFEPLSITQTIKESELTTEQSFEPENSKLDISNSRQIFGQDFGIYELENKRLGSLDFHNKRPEITVSLSKLIISGIASFNQATFRKNLYIYNSQLGTKLSLLQTKIGGGFILRWCVLPDTLDIRYLSLRDSSEVDLITNTLPLSKKKCIIFLEKDIISKIILPASLFSLAFEKSVPLEQRTAVYESLIKRCKDLGMVTSEQEFTIEYRMMINRYNWDFLQVKRNDGYTTLFPFGTWTNNINRYWWNFGYNKAKILWVWLPAFFLVFFLINCLTIRWFVSNVYRDPELGKAFGFDHELKSVLQNRIAYSLFYTGAIYFNIKLKYECINFKNIGGVAYIYVIYIIGLAHVTLGVLGYIFR